MKYHAKDFMVGGTMAIAESMSVRQLEAILDSIIEGLIAVDTASSSSTRRPAPSFDTP
jgi:sensor histidine kinase regulating citrate/malate metabolism